MKSAITTLLILFAISFSFSQVKKDTLNITQQFDKIYRISTSYQEYKVISKSKYLALKKDVSDSLNALKKEIQSQSNLITSQKDSISKSKKVIATLSEDLSLTTTEKNSISLIGISMSKSSYSILVWSLIVTLLTALLYFIYKFKSSDVFTTEAKNSLQELENEFATHKKKSLENEQKLRRQLQDEINKQRGV